jgi:hypothetical protein
MTIKVVMITDKNENNNKYYYLFINTINKNIDYKKYMIKLIKKMTTKEDKKIYFFRNLFFSKLIFFSKERV